ncbi:MAG: CPBP family intramembrane metalloprotease [Clostridia bacterium]|nr:CPBP family intramembrane metalloprotease [Clostridia bacterium]MBQ3056653.1 CPBP family intramembrane metalloprotease [Clostridia bacterium]
MSKWIPERPPYKKERRTVGFMALAAFLLLFFYRLFADRLPFASVTWLNAPVVACVAFLLPALAYVCFRGNGYTAALRLHFPRGRCTPLMIAAFFALFSGCLLLSLLTGGMETLGNSVLSFDTAQPEGAFEAFLLLIGGAILPALLEEFFFRGIIAVEYERRGAFRAVLMSALLFALLHFDISNLLSYLYAGVLLCLVLYATNSLWATVILHVLYNVLSLVAQRYLNALYEYTGTVQLFLFIFVVILLASLLFFCRACARIYRMRDEQGIQDPRRAVPYNVQFHTVLDALSDPAIILCFALSIAGFILL